MATRYAAPDDSPLASSDVAASSERAGERAGGTAIVEERPARDIVTSSMRALRDIVSASEDVGVVVDEMSYLRGQCDALGALERDRALERMEGAIRLALADARTRLRTLEREAAIDRGRVTEVSENVRMLMTRTIPALERAVGELRGRADAREGRGTWAGAAIAMVARMELAIGALALEVLYPSMRRKARSEASETSAAEASDASAATYVEPPPERVRVLGACLFIAVVEIAARASEFIDARAPARVRRSTAAAARGFRVARAVAWSSALARGLAATKEKCHAVALAAHVALAPSAPRRPGIEHPRARSPT